MNAYAEPERRPLAETPSLAVDSRAIDALFARTPGWFSRARTRKRLYKRGFPRAIERGRWLRSAVVAWIEREGSQPGNQVQQRRRRPAASSGYAEPGGRS